MATENYLKTTIIRLYSNIKAPEIIRMPNQEYFISPP